MLTLPGLYCTLHPFGARQVISATAAAEEAMAAAEAHITKLGPLMTGVTKQAQPLSGAARRAVLDRKKVIPGDISY